MHSRIENEKSQSDRHPSDLCDEDGELLVRVVRVDTTVLKTSHRVRWIVTLSDGRVGYVRTESEANWFRRCRDEQTDIAVTIDEQSPSYVKGLPPIVVDAASYEDEPEPNPF
jgi:hypothetical protein